MNVEKWAIGSILAGAIWYDLLVTDCLHVELIHDRRCNQLLLYADQTLLRTWSSDAPCLVRCFFEEKEFMELKAEDSECLSFFCQFPDTMSDNDFERIRQRAWKKHKDEENRKFNEEMRRQAELLSKPLVSMEKWVDKTPRNTTWWDKKARGRGRI